MEDLRGIMPLKKEPYSYGAVLLLILCIVVAMSLLDTRGGKVAGHSSDSQIASAETNSTAFNSTGSAENFVLTGKLNINSADAEDLAILPGIGPKTAEKIVEKRAALKGFSSIEDIKQVKGIGERKFNAISPYIEIKAGMMPRIEYGAGSAPIFELARRH